MKLAARFCLPAILSVFAVSESWACATSHGVVSGNLSDSSPIGSVPDSSATFADLDSESEARVDVAVFDALRQSHQIRVYFFRIGISEWQVYGIVDGADIVGGTPGSPTTIGSTNLTFDQNGNELAIPFAVPSIPAWANGARRDLLVLALQGLTLTGAATNVTANANGASVDCPQANSRDFDGDGVDDFVLWNKSRLDWSVRLSALQVPQILNRRWGRRGDVPLTGDVTGDGKADLIYWRPGRLRWYICTSDSAFNCAQPIERAVSGAHRDDVPVANDFDGDGVIDLGVYRARSGFTLHERSSSGSQTVTAFGTRGYQPVPRLDFPE